MERNENMIAALHRERDVYVRQGLTDRVQQVDEQLRYYGDDTAPEVPQGRSGREAAQQTADGPQKAPGGRGRSTGRTAKPE